MKVSYMVRLRNVLFMTIRRNVTRSTAHTTDSERAVTVAALWGVTGGIRRRKCRCDQEKRLPRANTYDASGGLSRHRAVIPWRVVHERQLAKAAALANLDDLLREVSVRGRPAQG